MTKNEKDTEKEFEFTVEETSPEFDVEVSVTSDEEVPEDFEVEEEEIETDEVGETDEEEEEETDSEDDEEQEEPEQEKSLYEQADEEFMDSIEEKPVKLTPEQSLKRQAELKEQIEKANQRLEILDPIADLAKSTGFKKLEEEIKASVHRTVDKSEYKDSKNGIKVLEAVDLVVEKVQKFNSEYYGIKRDIKAWESRIVELKGSQLSLLDDAQPAVADAESETEVELSAETEYSTGNELSRHPHAEDDGSDVLDEAIEKAVNTSSGDEEEALAS